jgi:hypothetical protein
MLVGKRAAALAEATRGMTGALQKLQARAFAGDFARWSVVIGGGNRDSQVEIKLDQLYSELERYDLIDQVEILAARQLITEGLNGKGKGRRRTGKDNGLLSELAATLPPASRAQLGLLGLPIECI